MVENFLDLQHGIVDPLLVTINSLRVAASIAHLILSTEVIIAEKERDGF
jgi:chaperonin GroEL (HSP60 family)